MGFARRQHLRVLVASGAAQFANADSRGQAGVSWERSTFAQHWTARRARPGPRGLENHPQGLSQFSPEAKLLSGEFGPERYLRRGHCSVPRYRRPSLPGSSQPRAPWRWRHSYHRPVLMPLQDRWAARPSCSRGTGVVGCAKGLVGQGLQCDHKVEMPLALEAACNILPSIMGLTSWSPIQKSFSLAAKWTVLLWRVRAGWTWGRMVFLVGWGWGGTTWYEGHGETHLPLSHGCLSVGMI